MSVVPMPLAHGQIHDATRIWEANLSWPLYSQCCVWDAARRAVLIWECVVAHVSVPGSQPPNTQYWRFIGQR